MDTAPCTSLGQKPARQIQIPQPTLTSSPKKTATNRKYNSQLSNRNNGSTVVDLHKQWGHTKTSLPQTLSGKCLIERPSSLDPAISLSLVASKHIPQHNTKHQYCPCANKYHTHKIAPNPPTHQPMPSFVLPQTLIDSCVSRRRLCLWRIPCYLPLLCSSAE